MAHSVKMYLFPKRVTYKYKRTKNIFLNETKSRDAAAKKNRYKSSRDKYIV